MEGEVDEITGLFKYRSYESAKQIVESKQLWFSRPTQFKDSFDCSPEILVKHFNFIYSETSDKLFEEELIELAEIYKKRGTVKQWLNNPAKVAEIYSAIQAPKIATSSVLCFCLYPHSREMWSEYGDVGKGICLGFDIKTVPFFDDVDDDEISMGPVTYGWPTEKINFFEDKIGSLKAIFLTKTTDLKHEEEFRMILLNKEGAHRFNKAALNTITFGSEVDRDVILSFRQYCIDNGFTNLKYYKILAELENLVIKRINFHDGGESSKGNFKLRHNIISYFIASVWLINGLFCKLLNMVPRHREIVARILGENYADIFTKVIGVAEICMFIWIVSRIKPAFCAITQILIIILMNIIEFLVAPDLLLYGRMNLFLALLFASLISYNEFILRKKLG
jgi:hypothetical protein